MGVTLGKMLSLLFLYATLMKRIVLHTHAHTHTLTRLEVGE